MLYRVRDGCTFGQSDQWGAGTVVELAPHEAAPFLDKLEPAAGPAETPSLDTESSDDAPSKGRRRRAGDAP